MKEWIVELCPDMDDWIANLIAEQAQNMVDAEREACAKRCDRRAEVLQNHLNKKSSIMSPLAIWFTEGVVSASKRNAAAIRARGNK